MKNRKNIKSKKDTKYVRINNSTWVEADTWIPDDVVRFQFLQKAELSKPTSYLGQLKNFVSNINT